MTDKLRKAHSICFVLFAGLIMLFALAACRTSSNNNQSDEFRASVGEQDIDLNSGITIQTSFPAEPDPEEIVSLLVFNHTSEDIYFKNSGFGLQLYCKDAKSWQKQNMPDEFVEENRVIPRKTETLDANLIDINAMNVNKSTVSQASCTQLRLFVQGVGQVTGKKYGAYADITINP